MTTYFFNVQRADGSLGLHAEATTGSMFTTALGYVALRILGLSADDARMSKMRAVDPRERDAAGRCVVGQVHAVPARPLRLARHSPGAARAVASP